MASSPAILRMYRHDAELTLQLEGRVTMHQRLPLRRVAEQGLATGVRQLRIDLRRCAALDSTILGTLVCLSRAAGSFALISPSESCQQILKQMGLTELFAVDAAAELPAEDWTDVPGERDEAAVFERDVVQAHQVLAELPGAAGEAFRGVAQRLRQERPPAG